MKGRSLFNLVSATVVLLIAAMSVPGAGQSQQTVAAPAARERWLMDFGWRFAFGRATDPSRDFDPAPAGEEVVQLYIKHLNSPVPRPAQELRGFKRVALKPGERKTVEIRLPAISLEYWNMDRYSFVLESGKIELLAGASSADIRLKKTVTVNN